jgi:hypothetical protein
VIRGELVQRSYLLAVVRRIAQRTGIADLRAGLSALAVARGWTTEGVRA